MSCPFLNSLASSSSSANIIHCPFRQSQIQQRTRIRQSISMIDIFQGIAITFLIFWFVIIFFFSFVEDCPYFSQEKSIEIEPKTIVITAKELKELMGKCPVIKKETIVEKKEEVNKKDEEKEEEEVVIVEKKEEEEENKEVVKIDSSSDSESSESDHDQDDILSLNSVN